MGSFVSDNVWSTEKLIEFPLWSISRKMKSANVLKIIFHSFLLDCIGDMSLKLILFELVHVQ